MKFPKAIKLAKKGFRIRRMCWGEDMKMWWNGTFFIHTHPYLEGEPSICETENWYPYVIEKDDLEATDWHVIA